MADIETDAENKVQAAIAPWATSRDRPPYSEEQLLVMALLIEGGSRTPADILTWIMDHFGYYRHMVAHATLEDTRLLETRPHAATPRLQKFTKIMTNVLRQSKFVKSGKVGYLGRSYTLGGGLDTVLGSIIGATNTNMAKGFRFFDLPAELRNYIYTLAFPNPKAGLAVGYRDESRGFGIPLRTLKKGSSKPFDFTEWPASWHDSRTRHFPHLLTTMLASSRFYHEAMTNFCKINHFHCSNLGLLQNFLKSTPDWCKSEITRISFHYAASSLPENKIATKTFSSLSELAKLQKLYISIDEQAWLRKSAGGRVTNYDSVKKIPGLRALRKVKADEVRFNGCPEIERMHKQDMVRPTATESKDLARKSRKRKASVEHAEAIESDEKLKKIKLSFTRSGSELNG